MHDSHTIKLINKIDLILKALLVFGLALILFLFIFIPALIPTFLILGLILCGGFYLPRQIGWQIRQRRAIAAKKNEQQKWQFNSRDREGPWINYIDYPLIYQTPITRNKYFYSEWLVIEDGYIVINPGPSQIDEQGQQVSYDLTVRRTYAWDGCTPKRLFYWLALIGTPDWWHREHNISILDNSFGVTEKTVFWQLAQHASLIHDALYQYLHLIPLSKTQVDKLFYDMLIQAELPEYLANMYLFFVSKFGANDVESDNAQANSLLKCASFQAILAKHKPIEQAE